MPGLCAPSKTKTLVGLCLLEFLSWGILFYTLPISSTRLANESNWPATVVPTVYTLSLLCSGLAGPFVGRLIDAAGPRCVMFWGAVRGAQTLAIATTVSDRWGKESYATIYGKFNFPIAICIALSPLLGELVASALGSYQYATLVFACASMVAVLLERRT
ncbi:MAG: hypothetical protein AB7E12_05795 [Burkholderiaceae bacterium]